jgi:hypothetical protein
VTLKSHYPKVEELKVIVQSMPSIKLSKDAKWDKPNLINTLEKNALKKILGLHRKY